MLYHGGAESTNTAAGSGEGGGHLRWNPPASSREPGAGAARSRVFCWRVVEAGEGPVGGRGLRGFFAFSGGRKGGRGWSREGCVLAVRGILAVLWGGWNRAGLPAGPAEAHSDRGPALHAGQHQRRRRSRQQPITRTNRAAFEFRSFHNYRIRPSAAPDGPTEGCFHPRSP